MTTQPDLSFIDRLSPLVPKRVASDVLCCSVRTIDRRLREGRLVGIKAVAGRGSSKVLITRESLKKLVEEMARVR